MGLSPSLLARLAAIVGADGVVARPDETLVYECDGYTLEKSAPEAVVLPRTTAETAAVVRALAEAGVAFVPRGAGTGLSGGALPVGAPVMVCTSRMRAIRAIDTRNRRVVAESGVVNAWVTAAVREAGLYYAPDPSSQPACTIGGNVAENSGGPHTLKYGVTTNHVLGVELVLPDGEVVELGGVVEDPPGYDLTGLVVGSEGTFGIVTRATLRLLRAPEATRTFLAVFETVDDATATISGLIARGIVPAALEMMDQLIVQAVEAAFHFGFPTDAGAVLIIELDGLAPALADEAARVEAVCRANRAREVRVARDEAERGQLWKARKRAFGAIGRLAPNYCTQDGVVPRTRVPEILRRISATAARHRLRIANVFHAGDGNIHPILLYDERDPDEVRRVLAAGAEILEACVALGGSITGEHGIGIEKVGQMPLIFSPEDLVAMQQVRAVFDPGRRCNPNKIFPTPGTACIDVRVPRRQAPL
jgi:glycolate oxidase